MLVHSITFTHLLLYSKIYQIFVKTICDVMLWVSLYATDSSDAVILCFAMQRYAFFEVVKFQFPRQDDSMLLTKLDKSLFGNTE